MLIKSFSDEPHNLRGLVSIKSISVNKLVFAYTSTEARTRWTKAARSGHPEFGWMYVLEGSHFNLERVGTHSPTLQLTPAAAVAAAGLPIFAHMPDALTCQTHPHAGQPIRSEWHVCLIVSHMW